MRLSSKVTHIIFFFARVCVMQALCLVCLSVHAGGEPDRIEVGKAGTWQEQVLELSWRAPRQPLWARVAVTAGCRYEIRFNHRTLDRDVLVPAACAGDTMLHTRLYDVSLITSKGYNHLTIRYAVPYDTVAATVTGTLTPPPSYTFYGAYPDGTPFTYTNAPRWVYARQDLFDYTGMRVIRIFPPVSQEAAGDTLYCHFPRRYYGFVRLTLRDAKAGEVIAVDSTFFYRCNGRMDEQACRRYTAAWQQDIVITGDSRFHPSQIQNIEAVEIAPRRHGYWEF